jgi:predicted ferric reductase
MGEHSKRLDLPIIIIFVLITTGIWLSMMPISFRFGNYDTATHSLGQITGLVGMVLFALSLVFTTKLKMVENASQGLDKVYKLHHKIGAIAFILLLFHPLLLVLNFIPSNWAQAAIYLWPSNSWGVNFGIISLAMMIILLVLTFFITLKYRSWRILHSLLGIAFIVGVFHIFLVFTDITQSNLLKGWMIFISAIGIISYLYGSYLIKIAKRKYKYNISRIENTGSFTAVYLKPANEEKVLHFKAGQFAFIRFQEEGYKEKHPFTIASKPGEEIRFVIKSLGDFTSKISKLNVGTTAVIEGPYGKFDYTLQNKDQIWIAGGVGITPFLSFAQSLEDTKFKKKIDLYVCTRNESEQVYMDELIDTADKISNFHVISFCSDKQGIINSEFVSKASSLKNKAIFICGPPPMMHSLKSQFIKAGVKKKNIFMEDFGFK